MQDKFKLISDINLNKLCARLYAVRNYRQDDLEYKFKEKSDRILSGFFTFCPICFFLPLWWFLPSNNSRSGISFSPLSILQSAVLWLLSCSGFCFCTKTVRPFVSYWHLILLVSCQSSRIFLYASAFFPGFYRCVPVKSRLFCGWLHSVSFCFLSRIYIIITLITTACISRTVWLILFISHHCGSSLSAHCGKHTKAVPYSTSPSR